MKKKILLVLLVVLMVGILAFSVFACNNDKKEPTKKPSSTDTSDGDDDIDDTDYLTPALKDVVAAIDNTIKGVNDINTAASVSANIGIKVGVGEESYDVALAVKGSIDKTAKAKNWAQIDAIVAVGEGAVEVSLFAVNNGEVEDLYIAQNIFNEQKQWNKLSQFEKANVLSDLACDSIIELVAGIDEATTDKIEGGLVNGFAGSFLPVVGMLGTLFVPGEGAANDFTVDGGYSVGLNIEELANLLPDLLTVVGGGLDLGDLGGIVNTVGGIILGGDLDLANGTFKPGADTPVVELGFGVENDLFTGLSIKYAGKLALEEGAEAQDISLELAISDLSLSGASKAYTAPFKGEPEELAIALDLDLTVPGIVEDVVSAEINVYPNVKMTFDQQGYVALDLSGLYAYATADIAGENYTIAEYNMNPDYPEDLFIDLTPIINALNDTAGANLRTSVYPINDITVFRVPVDLQSKFNNFIASQKAPVADPDVQNAINGNVVDYVIDTIVPGLFDDQGNFNVGGLLGVVGQLGDIIDAISPILTTDGLFAVDAENGKATLNLEVLMDALLVEDGIIDGITGEWNSFDLYNADGTKAEDMTLASILAEENVLGNIVALVNTLIYENYVKNVAEDETALSYADFFASEYAPTQLTENMVILSLKQLAGATVTADEFYTGLKATVSGYAQNGIGAALEVAIADGKLGIGIGARIIDNVAKTEETVPSIYYMGDQNGYAYIDQYQSEISASTKVSSNTGYDGGKLLAETLILMARSACVITEAYLDQSIYGIAAEGETAETAIAYNVGEAKQVTFGQMGPSLYYFVLTAEKDGTLVFTAEDLTASSAGLVINANEPIMGRPASYAISEVEVTAGQTYIFAVGSASGSGYAQVNVLVDYKAAE